MMNFPSFDSFGLNPSIIEGIPLWSNVCTRVVDCLWNDTVRGSADKKRNPGKVIKDQFTR